MICKVDNSNFSDYTLYINKHSSLFQRIEWIEASGCNEKTSILQIIESKIVMAGTYVFIEALGDKCLYFPRGPIFEKTYTRFYITELVEYLKNEAEIHNCKRIIFDCKYLIEADIEKIFIDSGFYKSHFSKFWHYNWGVNISNITAEVYLKQVKEKTRYNINYAIKNGIKVLIDNSEESIRKFYQLLMITAKRDNFKPKEYEHYKELFVKFDGDIELFWTYKDNVLVSSAIYVKIGNQAYYLYGASSSEYRQYMAPYLMQYKMIEYAISQQCEVYNMGGVGINVCGDVKYHDGLYQFKRKFGGFLQDSSYTYILKI